MATCKTCVHWDKCFKKDGTRYYGPDCACNNVERLCEWFFEKGNGTLTWSDPIENEKIRTHHVKIVVECTTGKPYYSIEWFDTAKQEYYLGYSSYLLDNVLGWLKENFEIVETPMTNADRIRAMSDEELANWLARTQYVNMMEAAEIFGTQLPFEEETLKGSEQECLEWLKQPAEEGE